MKGRLAFSREPAAPASKQAPTSVPTISTATLRHAMRVGPGPTSPKYSTQWIRSASEQAQAKWMWPNSSSGPAGPAKPVTTSAICASERNRLPSAIAGAPVCLRRRHRRSFQSRDSASRLRYTTKPRSKALLASSISLSRDANGPPQHLSAVASCNLTSLIHRNNRATDSTRSAGRAEVEGFCLAVRTRCLRVKPSSIRDPVASDKIRRSRRFPPVGAVGLACGRSDEMAVRRVSETIAVGRCWI